MTENVGELQALESRMLDLIEARNAVIDRAEQMIDQANKEFDDIAVTLGRAINEARAQSKPAEMANSKTKPRKARRKKDPEMEGLTDREKAAFRQMLAGKP